MNYKKSTHLTQSHEGLHEKFDLKAYLRRYLHYWYLFFLTIPLCLGAAYLYLIVTQPTYVSQTTLLIKDSKTQVGPEETIMKEMAQFNGNKVLENEIGILKSQLLMGMVVKQLNLDISFQARDGLKTIDLYGQSPIKIDAQIVTDYAYAHPLIINTDSAGFFRVNNGSTYYRIGTQIRTSWGLFSVVKGTPSDYREVEVQFHNPQALTRGMLGRLTVGVLYPQSTLLELSFEDTSVQKSKDILNKLLDVYVQSSLNDKNSEASNTLKFIESRLGLITGELSEVEKDVEVYKKSKGLTDISAESQLFLENIKENDSKLNEIETQIKVLESVDHYIQNAGDGAPAPATYMIDDPILVSLLTKFNELSLQRERYARITQVENPLFETVNTQMDQTRQAIQENVQNLKRGMAATKENLSGINTKFSSGLSSIPKKEREYVGIKRQQTIKENLYLYLLQKREETALAYASTVTDSRLVDAPISSYMPVKPKRSVIWLGAGLAGLVIPLILINLLFMLNSTVQNREEVERITNASILAEIGMMKGKGKNPSESIIKVTSRSAVAEQFRALRTNLQYMGDGSCRTIMLTSSISSEGKSFISINLAVSLASSDKRVILIGLDLRKPSLHNRLDITNKKGASNYLVGLKNLDELIQPSGLHPQFDVLSCGPLPPNPSELLSNGRLPELIAELRERYDYILIDSPPYGLVTDAALIAEHVDATLYVVRFNHTLLDHLKHIKELQRTKRFANLSLIYNGVDYAFGYGYVYGSGGNAYGYHTEDVEDSKFGFKTLKKLAGMF
ncbi:polysaccharide biosynthesis tyrosine autokinase [Dyadobacter sp. LJ53]|uniref:GumC family protein n=1 Tax=Dyadobacter chenwenxiniae TaxID=2906456 RepID=UPI001F3E3E19|nr:tyrosine-protein kinase [Dyadobacter chenwenxiniae]MCF0051783.1 polysaccharide biosynthesis tyrosine autokinase [Dyadobacter chenwenxiniae]